MTKLSRKSVRQVEHGVSFKDPPGSIVANEQNKQTTIFLGRVTGIVTYNDSSLISHFVMIQIRTMIFILSTYI